MKIIELDRYPIDMQLSLEESLLNTEDGNFCLLNTGADPAIVMGISSKLDLSVHLDLLPPNVPIVRRFSGGGTVFIDEETVFVTFICSKTLHSFPPYPEPILAWVESILIPITPGLKLKENDFVIGDKKCGGNALYIKKHRWLVHSSFLWSYNSIGMNLLKYPPKTPAYRAGRKHEDFVCPLRNFISSKREWMNSIKMQFPS